MKIQLVKPLFFFLISILLSCNSIDAQTPIKTYEKEWKKVEELVKKNLPKSALTEVKKIYELAKKDGSTGSPQDAQIIKSLVYMVGLQRETREENEQLSIKELEKEISTAGQPAKSILQSLVAELYWNYFQNRRWQLYNRSQTVDFKKDDIATWAAEDFHKRVSELFLQSIKEEKLLQQTKLEPYDAIIMKGNVRHLRPTLFDLLAHRALDYFKNDERDVTKPAYAFEIRDAEAFAPAADFVNYKFTTRDSLSLHSKALQLYQKLILFHLNDTKPDALIDVDIERIEFVNDKGVQSNKKELYLAALNHIVKKYENLPAAAQAWYLIAKLYEEDASGYKPYGDTTHRFDRLKAKEICEKILMQKDSSEGKINCYNLLNQIKQKTLQFSVEKVNVPNQPFRSLVKYSNFTNLYLRIIKVDEKLKEEAENYYDEKFWPRILAIKPLRSWEQVLPDTKDMRQHSVEIKVDALTPGDYMMIASTNKDFKITEVLGARLFYVSNISYINNNKNYFVLDRESGQPLVNAAVQVWERKYDYKTSKYSKEKAGSYKTNDKGYFLFDRKTDEKNYNYNFLLDVSYKNDRLFMNDMLYDYYYSNPRTEQPKESISVFLFTDRSIYRPGQTVYYKGITVSKMPGEKNSTIKTGFETIIYLRDANYQFIDSITITTNEYGSFSGKFQLPQSGLNGNFTLFMKNGIGSTNFSMEEYKRPKFYVEYEPIKGTYKVNDKIKVTGIAKAYAGNNIDGATVKYRVVRKPKFLYPWLFWRWWPPVSAEEMEIANGETKTDKDGKFVIEFTAIPDLSIDKKFEPLFDYYIYSDVTDINGETRSGEQMVSVGYKSLLLKVDIPETLPVDSLKTISIRTENMNGEFIPATVNVTITRLQEEKRLIRDRYWERPDQFVMSKEEYIKNFPHDEYDNETDYRSWEKGEKVFEKSDSVKVNDQWSIVNGKLGVGFYVVEITTKDKNGEEVKDVKYIQLFDEKNNRLSKPEYLWTIGSKPIEPGEKTDITVGTSAENVFLIQQVDKAAVDRPQSTANFSSLILNNEKKSFDFTATEADRGGYGVSYIFVKHNRFFQFGEVIRVPWTNKDLKIEYATFRDKTLPGSEERWKVKISGYKNEKVAAEMLASMYDASLDQFKTHSWNKPSVWSTYTSVQRWNADKNFTQLQSQQKWKYDNDIKYFYKDYDNILPISDESQLEGIVVKTGFGVKRQNIDRSVPVAVANEEIMGDFNKGALIDQRTKNIDTTILRAREIRQGSEVQIRKNFNETAFFFPDLHTDSTGAIEFSFTMPEALTKWKFQALTHTKDLSLGLSTNEIVTQKQLMVQPNAPRFLREGDKMEFSSKIVNLTEKELTGQASLQLFDATTNQPVDGWFHNTFPNQYFTVAAGQSEAVKFPIQVPYNFNKALVWRIVAKTDNLSDGEEMAMPVLTNKMLVTETMPILMRGTGTKNFIFTKLLNSGSSETLQHHALTVEYTSNPAWYAVQALPYLMEYPYDCAEQVWNRYYANSLASMIANSSPRIKQIFEQWKNIDTAALLSNLQKNQELKAVLLEETPWVLQAKSESEQKKNIALLFDMVKMSNELNSSFEKLKQMQSSNGGFVWFKGGPDDRYITQYIITGIGHLKKLKAIAKGQETKLNQILATALPYLDRKIKEDYDNLKKSKVDLKKHSPAYYEIQYLYMRSFFPDYPVANASQAAYGYFRERIQSTWTPHNKYMQGMIALALYRTGDTKTPTDILKSLKETSITNEELGMYWKNMSRSWFWYQAPIETQALLIEAFHEIGKDTKTVDDLRTWLLKNKQTTNWRTTKATAEACYALLLQGSEWLANEPAVTVKLGATTITSTENKQEAGTGYFKKTIDGNKVNPEMGNISVSLESSKIPPSGSRGASWGAVYWQYFESLDKITNAETPLKLNKKLFVEKNSDRGPVLTPVNNGDILKVGDKIKVRIEIRVDRDMEYVHMKDMRASALEPVNVLSSYKWQGGLGYYETTKDASTNFFFSYLRKGTYVFEYSLFVTHEGNFSNGVTTIQSMYAPEFSSHSEGIRITVE